MIFYPIEIQTLLSEFSINQLPQHRYNAKFLVRFFSVLLLQLFRNKTSPLWLTKIREDTCDCEEYEMMMVFMFV